MGVLLDPHSVAGLDEATTNFRGNLHLVVCLYDPGLYVLDPERPCGLRVHAISETRLVKLVLYLLLL